MQTKYRVRYEQKTNACTDRIAFDKWSKELVQRVEIFYIVFGLVCIVRNAWILLRVYNTDTLSSNN